MAALSTANPTLLDLAKITNPDGSVAKVAEILNQTNEILLDMTWVEGNLKTGHMSTARAGIPAPTWRKLYGGVVPTKGTTVQVTDSCGMLEAYGEVDTKLANMAKDKGSFLLSQNRAHIEGMNQELASTLFLGNDGSEPEAFTGLAPRFNLSTAPNGDNVILGGAAGGQTDNASIWLIGWSPETVHGIVPQGSTAGLQVQDLGEVTVGDVTNGYYQAYRSHFTWDAGLAVPDWRYIVRICNIDKSLLSVTWTAGAFSTGADLADLMCQAIDCIPNLSMVRPAFYMSRTIKSFLRRQNTAKRQGSTLTREEVNGVMADVFDGIPVRRCDALAADEALVS